MIPCRILQQICDRHRMDCDENAAGSVARMERSGMRGPAFPLAFARVHAGYNSPRLAKFRINAAAPKRQGGARSQVVTTLTKAPSFSDAIVTTSPT
jgi:hypothetical protein